MEFIVGLLSIAALVFTIWRKSAENQRYQDEIVQLQEVVKGMDAALKLKRLQERQDDERAKQDDLAAAERVRAAGSARDAIGFLRSGVRSPGPGPGDQPGASDLPGPEAPDVPGAPGKPVPGE